MHTVPNHNQSETQTTINSSLECLDAIDMASHQILFGARLDADEHEAHEPEEGQLEFEFPAIENSTDQVSSEKSALAKLDQQSMAAISQKAVLGYGLVREFPLRASGPD